MWIRSDFSRTEGLQRFGMECRRCLEPRTILLHITIAVTIAATGLLCAAIMTDHWDEVTWDKHRVSSLASSNFSEYEVSMSWYMNDKVSRIALLEPLQRSKRFQEVVTLFLVPVHGGIWTLCLALEDEEKMILQNIGFPRTQCVNYLTPENERMDWREDRTDWQHRMQNLSMSCSLVCLIILGASALVGAFGIAKHQISAVLVTGVMYLLAGTFALFTLMIIHYKRKSIISPIDRTSGGRDGAIGIGPAKLTTKLVLHYLPGRSYIGGWSLDLGWAALSMCIITASLWILLARVMRFTPFTSLIT